jgi:glycosyltransferase involved in cell wall biosynthesis
VTLIAHQLSAVKHLTQELHLLVDPIESLIGSVRPVVLLAEIWKKRYDITIVAPTISRQAREILESQGYNVIATKRRLLTSKSMATLEAWLRKEHYSVPDGELVINFSQSYYGASHIYYAQGPISKALDDIVQELGLGYRITYTLTRKLFYYLDKKFITNLRKDAKYFIANSKFCASMYQDFGVEIDSIIYPPLDTRIFRPRTNSPEANYVLTYFGKETKYSVIKELADKGIRFKAFGSRAPYIPKALLRHPNVDFVGKIDDDELAELYSNALFTLFTFTHEPFGYIPVESMACGTPVLSYAKQGPSESVIPGKTGWLARDDQELIELALRIWHEGVPEEMRRQSIEEAKKYDREIIAEQWTRYLG